MRPVKSNRPSDNYGFPSIHPQINKTPVYTSSIEALTPETDRKVSGVFVNVEHPGQPAKVCARLYKGMQYFAKVFEDGEKCEIPLSVARMINERIGYEEHTNLLDDQGRPIKGSKFKPRYKFMADFA